MSEPHDQRIADLEAGGTAKDAVIEAQRLGLEQLKTKVEELIQLVLTLKEQLDRNSSNSSKPPSSDSPD